MTIDLKNFCSADESRLYLMSPFNYKEATFATNGHIAVRVPMGSYPDKHKALTEDTLDRLVASCVRDVPMLSLDELALPSPVEGKCRFCVYWVDSKDCDECDGTGREWITQSVKIGIKDFDAKYIRLIATLPVAMIESTPTEGDPATFKFDGGCGCLMPLRGPYKIDLGDIKGFLP